MEPTAGQGRTNDQLEDKIRLQSMLRGGRERKKNCGGVVKTKYTVCSIWFGFRNETIVSLIWDFLGPKGPLCDPKTGRKLLYGKKFTQMDLNWVRKDVSKKEKIKLCQF